MRRIFSVLLISSLAVTGLSAQAPAPAAGQAGAPGALGAGRGGAPQGPQVVSPQVNADRTVTLRLLAPQATAVTVTGEILNGGQSPVMTKGADGVWTGTIGPLPVDIYTYGFSVDGVSTTDPRNPWIKLVSGTGLASQVQVVQGDALEYYDAKPVPHGLVQIMTYESKSLGGAARQAYVYTPPGYHQGNTRYPVLYLLHGGGDLDPGWTLTGRANFIMDNLIAEKRSVPMIVVMPVGRGGGSLGIGPRGLLPGVASATGNMAPGGGGAGRAGGAAPAPTAPAALGAFAQDFVNDLMPAVERTFRTRPGRESRAMAGLSAGGAATVNTVFSRPELFSHVVIMSAGAGQNVETLYPNFFGNNAAGAKQFKFVWVGAGDQDFALNGSRALSESLTKAGVRHEFVVNEGYRHEWRLWRLHVTQFVPKLFR